MKICRDNGIEIFRKKFTATHILIKYMIMFTNALPYIRIKFWRLFGHSPLSLCHCLLFPNIIKNAETQLLGVFKFEIISALK